MTILGIDSSAVSAGCAIVKDGRVLSEGFVNIGLTHSQTLMPLIDDTLNRAGLTLEQIDRIAVSHGPGSFTGVRIGIATVKGLAFAGDIPCTGVSTLAAIAHGAACADGVLCPVMDARRDQVYNALFACEKGELTRLCDDRAISLDDLAADIAAREETVWLCGDGAQLCMDKLGERCPNLRMVPECIRWQRGYGAAMAAQDLPTVDAASLLPVYLRLPQAERELRARKGTE
ncbi:MAG: tRNA (adenosine(37)-N6)-threonylcarbamoyltransferase complex dimerization subunit type 1 TsaB [Ruminococcaceae bacterium]|nr:tRNA (adenosine(37)-N6)-threonylcarbamoyltransferase complex dimerization subunit type 1 TsaB [Oscillospiraceae bacterium]